MFSVLNCLKYKSDENQTHLSQTSKQDNLPMKPNKNIRQVKGLLKKMDRMVCSWLIASKQEEERKDILTAFWFHKLHFKHEQFYWLFSLRHKLETVT